jgi:hypothetical protein
MAALNPSTIRRLQKLQQVPSVWEGDRRPMSANSNIDPEAEGTGECVIWVDGSQGMVRAMDMVSADTGPEVIVRTLLRAMEHPQSPAPAVRPQKIVVKDREIQFFLRGVLQDLGITIDYVPDLPLIDEIFRGLQEVAENRPPSLPPQYAEKLLEKAYEMWEDSPWEVLAEHQVISIELNEWDLKTLYVCILGKLGMDYGVLFYRSLDSLKRFRQRVVSNPSFEDLEEAFLGQDCLFVTYESSRNDEDEDDDEDYEDDDLSIGKLPASEIQPNFGNLHPLEGLRSILYEEEAAIVLVALEALHRFWRASSRKFTGDKFPSVKANYRIPLPDAKSDKKVSAVKVSTMPEVAEELMEMVAEVVEADFELDTPALRDDLVPPGCFLSLGVLPWESVEYLRYNTKWHQEAPEEIATSAEGLPVVLIQTSLPKANQLIEDIQEAEGLDGICFNPGEDPRVEANYDLGILKTHDGMLHLFGEFVEDDPVHVEAKKKWERRCEETNGWCGLIIARGIAGASRGKPQFKDMVALFEVRSVPGKELGLGRLQLVAQPSV